ADHHDGAAGWEAAAHVVGRAPIRVGPDETAVGFVPVDPLDPSTLLDNHVVADWKAGGARERPGGVGRPVRRPYTEGVVLQVADLGRPRPGLHGDLIRRTVDVVAVRGAEMF